MSFLEFNPTAAELDRRPTMCRSQANDLKFDDGTYRYWLARTGIADGEPYENTVYVEKLENGRWIEIDSYDGGPIDGSYESLRTAAQDAADAEQNSVDLYVMPEDGDEWILDSSYEPRTTND